MSRLSLFILICECMLGVCPAQPSVTPPPNIILILCDDLGWGDVHCYGHRSVTAHGGWVQRGELHTPHIDRLVEEGLLFTRFYVASGVCSPSRAAIITGQYPV